MHESSMQDLSDQPRVILWTATFMLHHVAVAVAKWVWINTY
jgi:hypothetical protein